ERYQALQLVVHHQRLRVQQDLAHGVDVHALQGDVLRGLVGFQHGVELLRLAGGQRDVGLLGALRGEHDGGGVAAGAGHDVVAVGFGLVAHALGVGVGALHVAEAFDHGIGRIDALELDLRHLDAGAVVVQDLLRLVVHVGFDLGAKLGQRRLDRGTADHLADRAFGHRLHQVVRIAHGEQVLLCVVDLPEHGEVDVDDVLIPGQHQAFRGHVAPAAVGVVAARRAVADFGAVDAGDGGQQDLLDRPGQVPVQAGVGAVAVGAETQHDAEFVRLHAVEAAGEPQQDDGDADQQQRPAAGEAHAGAAAATADDAADGGLQAGDQQVDVGDARTAGAATAWSAGTRAAGAAAAPWAAAARWRTAGTVARAARRKPPGTLAAVDHRGSVGLHGNGVAPGLADLPGGTGVGGTCVLRHIRWRRGCGGPAYRSPRQVCNSNGI